jgi:hypothetical protein
MKKTDKQVRMCGAMPADIREQELDNRVRVARIALESATRQRRTTNVIAHRGLLRIPLVVHVVYSNDEQNISDGQIESQVAVLNQDFRSINPVIDKVPDVWRQLATDCQVEFQIADVKRKSTKTKEFSDNDDVKFSSRGGSTTVDPEEHLNIWVCNLTSWLGYAYLPGIRKDIDGVVVRNTAFGTEGIVQAPFDLGRTTTHEIGHYLNLHHIWGGNSQMCGDSDYVDDTPNQLAPNYKKPKFPSISCNNGPHGDMFMNFMDYVDDEAMFMFTAQQVVRMRTALSQSRPKLGVLG